uniref:Uncharacterized protein n=1 Tax=Poecilia formosa TaxID=48698 RepID=A0A096LTA3_POEFO
PTGALELAKLKNQAKLDKQKIDHLEYRIKYLEESNRELRSDKEFLVTQIKGAMDGHQSMAMPVIDISPKAPQRSSVTSSSSKSPTPLSSSTNLSSMCTLTNVNGVVARYQKALKTFTKYGSMKRAFWKINVDRNTIARTAVIAELAITFPDVFKELIAVKVEQEKICELADRCRKAITNEMAETITSKKRSGKLLPIMHKYTYYFFIFH